MRFKCRWYETSTIIEDHCKKPAETMIIYGCAAEHINEIWFCAPHTIEWIQGQNHKPKKCWECHNKILEYLPIHTTGIKDDYISPGGIRYPK